VRALLEPAATESTSDELIKAASSLAEVVSDDWHKKADLLVAAIHRLQTKEIAPDQTIKLLGVPLQENKLRDAAEAAFRNCADFAETDVDRIALIDAANEIRRQTWF
jgi:hypothetical protein